MSLLEPINDALKDSEPTTIIAGTLGASLLLWAGYKIVRDPANVKRTILGSAINAFRSLPAFEKMVNDQMEDALSEMRKQIHMVDDDHKFPRLPLQGLEPNDVVALLAAYRERETKHWKDGNVSGVVYHGSDEHTDMMNQALSMFSLANPLHPDVFVSVRKFEAEIASMTANMLNGGDANVVGAVTSGGTESILMAVKAHRDYYRERRPYITQPEIVVAESAHAAFDKACQYFGLKLVKVPVGADHRADVNGFRKAINSNTILVVGSAPSYPHGMIDPIEDIAVLARQFDIGFHVDACLGGFFLPWARKLGYEIPAFDFGVAGVTSMSADTHKYGFAVKGTSVVLFRNSELRSKMFFVSTEWSGGIYASPTIAGSRPGALIAACWASMVRMGESGYMAAVKEMAETHRAIKGGIPSIPGLYLVGDSHSMVVSVASHEFNIFMVSDCMSKRGWNLNAMQSPHSIHLCVTYRHVGKADKFLQDLRESVEEVRAHPDAHKKGAARIYGMAYGLPDRGIVADIARGYLEVTLAP